MKKQNVIAIYTDFGPRKGVSGGCGYYRVVQPMRYIEDAEVRGNLIYATDKPETFDKIFEGRTHVIIENTPKEIINSLLELKKQYGFKLISEYDDDYLAVDPSSPFYETYHKGTVDYEEVVYQLEHSDAIIVTCDDLKKSYSKYNKNIFICPNQIDPDDWDFPEMEERTDGRIRIGWAGSYTHEKDLTLIVDALKVILRNNKNVDLCLCGYRPKSFNKLPGSRIKEFKSTNHYYDYPIYLTKLDFDIGLAPLCDMKFNKSKSNIKWMEYAMAGCPVVASPVGPYKCINNGVDGFLATTTAEWISHIQELIDDKRLRVKMRQNARERILKEYNIKINCKLWQEVLNN